MNFIFYWSYNLFKPREENKEKKENEKKKKKTKCLGLY